MQKTRIEKIWLVLSGFFMCWPVLFYLYLQMGMGTLDFKTLLQTYPVLNLQLINAFLIFFMGYIMFQFRKKYTIEAKNARYVIALLILIGLVFCVMQQFSLALAVAFMIYLALRAFDLLNMRIIQASLASLLSTGYHKGGVAVLVIAAGIAYLQFQLLNR